MAIKLAATLTLYLFPFVAAAALLLVEPVTSSAPILPAADEFDTSEQERQISNWLREKRDAEIEKQACYQTGQDAGIQLTKGSGYKWFSERGDKGKQLNEQIRHCEAIISRTEQFIEHTKSEVYRNIPNWSADFREWSNLRARHEAIRASLSSAGILILLCYVVGAIFYSSIKEGIDYLGGLLLWKPSQNLFLEPAAVAFMMCAALFALSWQARKRTLLELLEDSRSDAWRKITRKWAPYSETFEHFEFADSEEPLHRQNQDENGAGFPSKPSCWDVLGISADASIEAIRSAYIAALKGCHPDKVAHLSPALREVAEQEAKKLNLAFEEAKISRGA